MTLPTDNIRADAIGTGSTATYSFTFKIFEESDLIVTVVDADGVESVKTLNVDYTVTGVGQQAGGTIVLSSNLANGYGINIRARSDLTQETSIRNQSGFNPAVIEREFDLLCRADQVQQEQIDRSLKAPVTSAGFDGELPSPMTPNSTLAVNESGLGFKLVAASNPSAVGAGVDLSAGNILATGATTARSAAALARDAANVKDWGVIGDGATNDTAQFTAYEAVVSGRVVDLCGLTYVVSAIPSGNIYVNGLWKIGGTLYQAGDAPSLISDATDTGGIDTPYGGGSIPVPTVSGRTNSRLRALIASQNCRSTFARSACVASIYSQATGNLSINLAARQSIADCPQSANLATEECVVYGFRGANVASEFSRAEGSSAWNVGADTCRSSAENAGNLGSYDCVAGRGYGINVTLTIVGGVITGYVINSGGLGYNAGDTMRASDRINTPSVTAVFTFTVNGSGTVTGITIVNGGAGYSASSTVDLRIDTLGGWSVNMASARCLTQQQFAANIASDTCTTKGRESANIASDSCTTNDDNQAIIAGVTNSAIAAGAIKSAAIAVNNCNINASGGFLAAGLNSNIDHSGCVLFGRRTATFVANSFVWGDNSTGSTLTSNRKFQITSAGAVTAAGTFTGSTVFTDYAEFFENRDNGVIPLGTLVALDGRKVRPSAAGDTILGVVSATALIVAGDSPFQWGGRYLTGEFGEMLYDTIPDPDDLTKTIQVPRPNPAFDETIENVPRSERPAEWTCVGLLGQVHVRVGSLVGPGDYIRAGDNGVGERNAHEYEPFGETRPTNMRCMEIRRPFDSTKGYAVAFCLIR